MLLWALVGLKLALLSRIAYFNSIKCVRRIVLSLKKYLFRGNLGRKELGWVSRTADIVLGVGRPTRKDLY